MTENPSASASYSAKYTTIPPDSPWQGSYASSCVPCRASGASYAVLGDTCRWCESYDGQTEYGCLAAPTDRTRWACPSLPTIPMRSSQAFFRLLNVPQRLDELPSFHVPDEDRVRPASTVPPTSAASPTTPSNEKIVNFQGRFEIAPIRNENNGNRQQEIETERKIQEGFARPPLGTDPPESSSFSCSASEARLLPIMDYAYNIREMVKNCILLEDHLVHPEKRCNDCCVKHFLFLEALAEEARTLDREQRMCTDLRQSPDFFRACQRRYHTLAADPQATDTEYQEIAQRLREFRKLYQQQYFAVPWQSAPILNTSVSGCINGRCPNTTASV